MCGIFAAISFEQPFSQVDYKKFVDATDLVSYRGPDAFGYKTFNCFPQKFSPDSFNIFFGHRRLSIIDLSKDGNQPMTSNGIHIIYNGEIFNYIELREELKAKNISFQTNSDTEVILKIYQEYGSKGFNKLNGMWAFIIYDSNKNLFIASRDRFSIKPLFWTTFNNKFYFASEIKQLLKLVESANLNKRTMSVFLMQGLLDINNETFFEGVEKLEPKQNLIIDLNTGKISKEKYWDYQFTSIPEKQIYEMFLELFCDSVKIRLRSDVELGALLSGGLDSSAISIIGKKSIGDSFSTFTVIPDNEKYSEEKFADLVVNENKLKNRKLLLETSTILNNFNKVLYHQDEPFSGFVVMAHYAILEKIKSESDIIVVLNGQGGDEVLLGYLRFFFFYLKKLYSSKEYMKFIKEILASIIYRTVLTQWKISAAKRYIPKILNTEKKFLLNKPQLINTWEHTNLREAQIADIDRFSVPILTRYEDRNSMAHSLEIRLPFLDHRLVEFLLSLRTEYKIKNGWTKYILRKSFTEMPVKIRWRRDKKGFSLPEEQWLKNDFRKDIFNSIKDSYLDKAGIISSKNFLNYYSEFLNNNKRIHNFDISRVYIAEKWMKKFFN